jgi:Cytochrome C oxidase, cbb3-type, subunit III
MHNPQWAVDLRTFPRDGHARFVDAVADGKRNMPAWDDVLDPEQIEALWAYVIAGEAGVRRLAMNAKRRDFITRAKIVREPTRCRLSKGRRRSSSPARVNCCESQGLRRHARSRRYSPSG